MKKYGIVSYNIHGNYTNYGSVLQSYALQKALNQRYSSLIETCVINYCPEAIIGKNPLDPLQSEPNPSNEFRDMINRSMPAIIENYEKINGFVEKNYKLSNGVYTKDNFADSFRNEELDGYIIGSDAIWMVDFFGFDKAFWGDYPVMKQSHTFTYATSFGESEFAYGDERMEYLRSMIGNFKAIGLREAKYLEYISENTSVPVKKVVDPTLLLKATDYSQIIADRCVNEPYILLYSRKYNPNMEKYADAIAKEHGYKVVEISLRAQNSDKHQMFYNAGIEEFLSLIKYAENVVTNSLHASIFSTLFHRPISFFNRGNASYKVREFFNSIGILREYKDNQPLILSELNYDAIDNIIECNRLQSYGYLDNALKM